MSTGPTRLLSTGAAVTDDAAPGLNELHRRFGNCVRFVMINVREAHPGDACRQPHTPAVKLAMTSE